jgi:hypothetical protein
MEFALNISVQSKLLISAGVIASVSAIWHLLFIFGGPSWFVFARAPQQVIESAQQQTMLAPISTVFVAQNANKNNTKHLSIFCGKKQ